MAEILIRGIDGVEIPKRCEDCRFVFFVGSHYKCLFGVCKDACPLFELPEHGDLICRDAAYRMMLNRGFQREAVDVILDVPSVVPANKEVDR